MKYYHGTNKECWKDIKKEKQLLGHPRKAAGLKIGKSNNRYTCLTPDINEAKCYGNIILEVEYMPIGKMNKDIVDGFYFGKTIDSFQEIWELKVFVPIHINQIRKLTKKEVGDIKFNEEKTIIEFNNYIKFKNNS